MSNASDLINEHVTRFMREENARIERELIFVLGWRVRLPRSVIRGLGYEIVYQTPPIGGGSVYRGIRRHGKWVIDHHADWPQTRGTDHE
jgi:hypothetical protein